LFYLFRIFANEKRGASMLSVNTNAPLTHIGGRLPCKLRTV